MLSKHKYLFFAIVALLQLACKKEKVMQDLAVNLEQVTIANTTQNSITLSYALSNKMFTETGIVYAADSLSLVNSKDVIRLKGVLAENRYKVVLRKLKAFTPYWYRVFTKDASGSMKLFEIKKAITNGYNIRWDAGFTGTLIQKRDFIADLNLLADQPDLNVLNYKATYGGKEFLLMALTKVEGTEDTYKLVFGIRDISAAGKLPFKLFYKNSSIFEDQVIYDNSNQLTAVKVSAHPIYNGGAFFKYGGMVYTLTQDIKSWNPVSNSWVNVAGLPGNMNVSVGYGDEGLEINGKIWFRPFSDRRGVGIRSYTPATNTWDIKWVENFLPTDLGTYSVDNVTTFVYKEKFYVFLMKGLISAYPANMWSKNLLCEYDPAKGSWKELMELNRDLVLYKGVAFNDKVYVTAVGRRTQYTGSYTDTKSLWYELNIDRLELVEKAPLVIDGFEWSAQKPTFFNYKERLFMYGGKGYSGYETRNIYEYLAAQNTWKRFFIQNANDIPGESNFTYVLNNKIYIGMGATKDIFELKFVKE